MNDPTMPSMLQQDVYTEAEGACSGIQVSKKQNISSLLIRKQLVKIQYCGKPSCSRNRARISNPVSPHLFHHPQEAVVAQFNLNVHRGGWKNTIKSFTLKPNGTTYLFKK